MANQSGTGFYTVRKLSCSMKQTVQQVSKCGGLSQPRALHLTLITASNWSGIFGARISQVTWKCDSNAWQPLGIIATLCETSELWLHCVWTSRNCESFRGVLSTYSVAHNRVYMQAGACLTCWRAQHKEIEKGQACHLALCLQGCRQSM